MNPTHLWSNRRRSDSSLLTLPKTFSERMPLDLLALVIGIGAVATLYGGWRAFYFESSFLAPIAYVTDERPTAEAFAQLLHISPAEVLMGIHAFHDFGISYYWGSLANPWLDNQMNFWPNHSPLAMLLGRAWQVFSYAQARDINLILMAVAMIVPVAIAVIRRPWPVKVLALSAVALSGPFIAALDRGNYQGYIPLLLFGFGLFVLRGRWGLAGACVVLAASFKVYPIVLVVLFIAERRWRALIGTLVSAAVLNVLLLFAFEGPVKETARMYLHYLTPILGQQDSELLSYNVSFTGGVLHWLLLLNQGGSGLVSSLIDRNFVILLVVWLLVVPILWMRRAVPLVIRVIAVLMLTTLVTPVVFPYTANWSIAALALVVLTSRHAGDAHDIVDSRDAITAKVQQVVVMVTLALVLAFYPVFIPHTMESGYPAGMATLMAPVAVLVFATAMWWSLWRSHRTAGMPRADRAELGSISEGVIEDLGRY